MGDGAGRYPQAAFSSPNRLAGENSPYLLQHAHNPVDWYPWGEEAFAAARRRDCPIFLSIGYSTCYWCHVMERQVFDNPSLAALLNDSFVSIKVDREQRPDLDEIYMTALQIMTGRGGWPMSLFLTPPSPCLSASQQTVSGLEPFYAGTYFPAQATAGMPGFAQVLRAVADAWRHRRADVLAQAHQVAQAVRRHLQPRSAPPDVMPGMHVVQAAVNEVLRTYDHAHGGFGGAPKFPQPANLLFLLRVYLDNRDEDLRHALVHTLQRMARGGLFDQLAGGFHRYSVDAQWLVPHFEKMLYDNGQLLELYALAQASLPSADDPDLFARVARRTADYLLQRMTDPSGAFWSAQDAEVAGREGAPYVWTTQQVAAAIADPQLAARALEMYGLDRGPNFHDPHHPEAPPANVLYLPRSVPELAGHWRLPLAEVLSLKQDIDRRLLAVRDRLPQPATDDKILASWNGLAIAGLAVAARVLAQRSYADAAARAADAVLRLMAGPDRGLFHTMRAGQASVPGFLEDYAHLSHGLLELHRTTRDDHWLNEAQRLTAYALQNFRGFDALAGPSDLFARPRSRFDVALPSARSELVHNLLDIYELTREDRLAQAAAAELRCVAPDLQQHGPHMLHMVHALFRALQLPPRLLQAQTPEEADTVTAELTPQAAALRDLRAEFQVLLTIAPGYHIYAHDPAEGVLSTTLTLADGQTGRLEVRYPPGSPLADGVSTYAGRVVLPATLVLAPGPPPLSVELILRYQPCTDRYCLPPRERTLVLRLLNAE